MPFRWRPLTIAADLSMGSQIFIDEKPDYYDFANKTKMMTGAGSVCCFCCRPLPAEAKR